MHPQERPYLSQKSMQASACSVHHITSINSVTFEITDFLPYFKQTWGKHGEIGFGNSRGAARNSIRKTVITRRSSGKASVRYRTSRRDMFSSCFWSAAWSSAVILNSVTTALRAVPAVEWLADTNISLRKWFLYNPRIFCSEFHVK